MDPVLFPPQGVLDSGVGTAFPGAVACVWAQGEPLFHQPVGHRALIPRAIPNTTGTVYDLASLTKAMAVGTLLMKAVADGLLTLDEPVSARLSCTVSHWDAITIRHLASHCSGLPAWADLSKWLVDGHPTVAPGSSEARSLIQCRVLDTPLESVPGTRTQYSDLGFLLLGWILEETMGAPLDALFQWVRREFDLKNTSYRRLGLPPTPEIAPTEDCPMRQRVLTGEVHDPNAWMLGGVAGHAGLFGTAADVALWGKVLLDIWQGRDGRLPPEIVRQFWSPDASPSSETTTWRLCFDGVSSQGSSTGQYFGSKAVGHLGFTGTSIWLEPEIDLVVVLLSNRVHPTVVEEPPIKAFRPRFHDAMYKAFGILGR